MIRNYLYVYPDLIRYSAAFTRLHVKSKNNFEPCFAQLDGAKAPSLAGRDLQLGDKEFIEQFVEEFLWPYIQGRITPENEQESRKSMMTVLHEKLILQNRISFKPGEIEAVAFKEYLYRSCLGIYIFWQKNKKLDAGAAFESLVSALTIAIPKDFPEKNLSYKKIRNLAKKTFLQTNKERAKARQEIQQYANEKTRNSLREYGDIESRKLVVMKEAKLELELWQRTRTSARYASVGLKL